MMYDPNLPIEKQRRLDQWWSNQAQWGQAAPQSQPGGTRTGLDSMFDDSGHPNREEYEQAQRVAELPLSFEDWIKSRNDRGPMRLPRPADHGPGSFEPEVMPRPGPQPIDMEFPVSRPLIPFGEGTEVMPQPEYPLPGPPNRPPPDFPQLIDMPRPPVMLPLPGQENPYPVGPIRPEVIRRPGKPRPEVTPRPGPQAFLGTLLPTGRQQSGLTYSDDEKIRPPSIQVSRKHGGSLTQTVLNVLRNLS